MRKYVDNQLVNDENSIMRLSVFSVIGGRQSQQDSFDYCLKSNEGIVVICDGMGGHEGGQLAGALAAERFIDDYKKSYPSDDITCMLIQSAKTSDEIISNLKNDAGIRMNAGSTCVAVVIRNNKLYWCSSGDSRGYLLRGEEFVQLTQDQNYGTVLHEQLRSGIIDEERFNTEIVHSEALISYLGIGNLSLIDYNLNPLPLESDDKIILMSDGLFKLVTDEEIKRVLKNFKNNAEALQALNAKAERSSRVKKSVRDNMTAAIISVK